MTTEERERLTHGVRWAVSMMTGSKKDKAGRLGVSLTTLNVWLAGAGVPAEQNLARISRQAGVEQEEIRQGGSAALEAEAS